MSSARSSLADRARLGTEIGVGIVRAKRELRRNQDVRDAVQAVRRRHHGARAHSPQAATTQTVNHLAATVSAFFERLPGDEHCLTRSLVLVDALARRGVESTLVLGVQAGGSPFAAHAWVMIDDRDLLPRGPFEPLARL